jgi:hypothetical protein
MLHVPAQRGTTHPILLEDDGDILMHFFELRKTRFFAVAWISRAPPALIPPSSSLAGVSTYSAHPEDSLTNGYFPQLIFIDSMSFAMSSLPRFGTRWPGANVISVLVKSLSS